MSSAPEIHGRSERVLIENANNEISELFQKVDQDPSQIDSIFNILSKRERHLRLTAEAVIGPLYAKSMVDLLFHVNQPDRALEAAVSLTKRRAQFNRSYEHVCSAVEDHLDCWEGEALNKVLESILKVAEGKIFVEAQHTRMALRRVRLLRELGRLQEAATLAEGLSSDTVASLPFLERAGYLLDQIDTVLAAGDHVKALILADKLRPSQLEGEERQAVRAGYFRLLARIHTADEAWPSVACDLYEVYLALHSDPSNVEEAVSTLESCLIHLVKAPTKPKLQQLLSKLNKGVMAPLPLVPIHLRSLAASLPSWCRTLTAALTAQKVVSWTSLSGSMEVVKDRFESEEAWDQLRERVVDLNVRVICKAYESLTLTRLSQLLEITPVKAEAALVRVDLDVFYVSIDRPAGIVDLQPQRAAGEVADAWVSDVKQAISNVTQLLHLIELENQ
eukprot:gnl/Dysnectes_brevis/2731_a3317_1295.p2 GENE.gnl/Dysnectes_brevis/2731_a3317_1295~~gnl/Dysnectes_brevis/2731_a3317_1295.p2  ORF type:complete len:448 (+),score=57.86 gnl/Dysnectes_brevis/2731_a3317_1295:1581-2924(+)